MNPYIETKPVLETNRGCMGSLHRFLATKHYVHKNYIVDFYTKVTHDF